VPDGGRVPTTGPVRVPAPADRPDGGGGRPPHDPERQPDAGQAEWSSTTLPNTAPELSRSNAARASRNG
jgi:hypothetical protein